MKLLISLSAAAPPRLSTLLQQLGHKKPLVGLCEAMTTVNDWWGGYWIPKTSKLAESRQQRWISTLSVIGSLYGKRETIPDTLYRAVVLPPECATWTPGKVYQISSERKLLSSFSENLKFVKYWYKDRLLDKVARNPAAIVSTQVKDRYVADVKAALAFAKEVVVYHKWMMDTTTPEDQAKPEFRKFAPYLRLASTQFIESYKSDYSKQREVILRTDKPYKATLIELNQRSRTKS